MRLYQIPLPVVSNNGTPYGTHHAFLARVAEIAGGYTRITGPIDGVWRDPKTGAVYSEAVTLLQVACELVELSAIKDAFKYSFPDQIELMYSDIGSVNFIRLKD
jgi:hypothetical protein